MRHHVKGKALGRNTKQRKALFKGMLRSLFEEGAIETTETKAKIIRRLADKIITKAKPQTLNARRTLESFFGSKQVVNHIVDGVVPAVADRQSGFTTLTKLGHRRGDDASMVKLQLVNAPVEKPVKAEVVATAKKAAPKKAVSQKAVAQTESKDEDTKAKKPEVKAAAKAPAKKAVAKKAPAKKVSVKETK